MARIAEETVAEDLIKGLLAMETAEEMQLLLEDVCTPKEIQAIAQRYEVARLLTKGVTYADIAELTGASTATISRVNRSLKVGKGYQIAFPRVEKE